LNNTLSKVTGYSGNADATALAPAKFVVFDKPTKNSRPVNRTSPPSIVANESLISTILRPSRLSIVLIISTYTHKFSL
jgi:hypothetical protein